MPTIKMKKNKSFANGDVWKKGSKHEVTTHRARVMSSKNECTVLKSKIKN